MLKLVVRYLLKKRWRSILTVVGVSLAMLAVGVLETAVDAWNHGAQGAAAGRLIVRNGVSLAFVLPRRYERQIKASPGVAAVSPVTWFGGIYGKPTNFFPQFAVGREYFDIHPELKLRAGARNAFESDQRGCIVGRKLAEHYGLKIGDALVLKGTIFPGQWPFVIRGIYDGADMTTDKGQMFFHLQYLNETLKQTAPRRANQAGFYVVKLQDHVDATAVAAHIDAQFADSLAETRTDTEQAFKLGILAMVDGIVKAVRVLSITLGLVILALLANTMSMASRERLGDYAALRAMGFSVRFIAGLIALEAASIALLGTLVSTAILVLLVATVTALVSIPLLPLKVTGATIATMVLAAILLAAVAAFFPVLQVRRTPLIAALRAR